MKRHGLWPLMEKELWDQWNIPSNLQPQWKRDSFMKYCFPSGNRHGKRKKRCTIKDTMSIKITFMHYRNYITWTRVKLLLVFEEFYMVYIFWLPFSFHLYCQLHCFLNLLNFTFSVICLSETWWDDLATIEKSLFELPNYNSAHQAMGNYEDSGVSIYINYRILQWNVIWVLIITMNLLLERSSIQKEKHFN